MANYRSNRGPMYSSIQNLNTIPTEFDNFALPQDGFDMDQAELDMFMNTQLFDFDMGTTTENNSPAANNFADNEVLGMMAQQPHQQLDFNLSPEFNLSSSTFSTLPSNVPQQQPQQQQQQLQSKPQQHLPTQFQAHLFPAPSTTTSSSSSSSSGPINDLKRKATEPLDLSIVSSSTGAEGPEEAARFAAEEDKRRRNTAASARFRVKKKQREAQLEKTAKEMTDKVRDLEQKVGQLEMENKLLKELVTEKRGEGEVEGVVRQVKLEMGKR